MPDLDDPLRLTQELVTITNYTRAAYGYVMAAGAHGGLKGQEGYMAQGSG